MAPGVCGWVPVGVVEDVTPLEALGTDACGMFAPAPFGAGSGEAGPLTADGIGAPGAKLESADWPGGGTAPSVRGTDGGDVALGVDGEPVGALDGVEIDRVAPTAVCVAESAGAFPGSTGFRLSGATVGFASELPGAEGFSVLTGLLLLPSPFGSAVAPGPAGEPGPVGAPLGGLATTGDVLAALPAGATPFSGATDPGVFGSSFGVAPVAPVAVLGTAWRSLDLSGALEVAADGVDGNSPDVPVAGGLIPTA